MGLFSRARRAVSRIWNQRHARMTLRRWEAAQTDRLNEAHWKQATQDHVNADLSLDLETLRQRILAELENNPFLAGVVETHVSDVVGENGPSVQVSSASDEFDARLEAGWRAWWARPEWTGRYSGVDLLDQGVRQFWTQGSFYWQKTVDPSAVGVQLRLLEVHPRRLSAPFGNPALANVVLGIERDKYGAPVAYHVREALPGELAPVAALSIKTERIEAANMIHRFRRIETGQVDGIPWLASTLQVAADLRDYDAQVLDAARAAADWAVLLYAQHEDAPFFEINESAEFQRRRISMLPPGWKPEQMRPEQPAQNYVQYREERQREIARVAGMPLMLVRLDSSKSNFASARFDAKQYVRQLRKLQGWLSRSTLTPLLEDVRVEMELSPPDGGYSAEWTWEIPEFSGDPGRDARAEQMRLSAATATLREIVNGRGKDYQAHLARLKREIEELEDLGIVHPAIVAAKQKLQQAGGEGGDAAVQETARTLLEELLEEQGPLRGRDGD